MEAMVKMTNKMKVELTLNHIDEVTPEIGEEDIIVISEKLDEARVVRFMMWNEGDPEDEVTLWQERDGVDWDLHHTPYWCRFSDISKV
jgi:hypothetical protein